VEVLKNKLGSSRSYHLMIPPPIIVQGNNSLYTPMTPTTKIVHPRPKEIYLNKLTPTGYGNRDGMPQQSFFSRKQHNK
jgi:hypothetical protein